MRHLSSEELVDLLDDALPAGRREHLASCQACRGQAEAMSGMLNQVLESSDPPEPSPLYWDHLSARITEGIAADAATPKLRFWWPRPVWAVGLAAVALGFGLLQALPVRMGRAPASPAMSQSVASGVRPALTEAADDIDHDEAWAVVRTLADQLEWDEAHDAGISARPDAAERLTAELTSREQSELARLLQREMKRPGT